MARLGHAALAVGLVWVVAWPVFVALRGVGPREGVVLRWDALDVGDGSAHLLRSGGEAVMFDCGSSWYGVGERVLPRAMRALGAWRAATVIVSHPDSDHYSGLLDCASPLGVERVIVGEAFVRAAGLEADGPEAFVLAGLEARGVEVVVVSAGAVVEFGGARMTALWPPEGYVAERDNDASLVWLVEAGGWRVLLTGDIEAEAMDGVGRAAPGLRVDAMEAPHHGSARGFAYGFVEGMLPRVVVQSTGVSRLGDERWDGVKEGVERWLVTARDGAVWVEFGSRPGELTAGAPRSQRGEESEER